MVRLSPRSLPEFFTSLTTPSQSIRSCTPATFTILINYNLEYFIGNYLLILILSLLFTAYSLHSIFYFLFTCTFILILYLLNVSHHSPHLVIFHRPVKVRELSFGILISFFVLSIYWYLYAVIVPMGIATGLILIHSSCHATLTNDHSEYHFASHVLHYHSHSGGDDEGIIGNSSVHGNGNGMSDPEMGGMGMGHSMSAEAQELLRDDQQKFRSQFRANMRNKYNMKNHGM